MEPPCSTASFTAPSSCVVTEGESRRMYEAHTEEGTNREAAICWAPGVTLTSHQGNMAWEKIVDLMQSALCCV